MSLPDLYGPWALVTGATSGIGRSFANRLAAEGFNIVLVARREQVLLELGAELSCKYGVETRSIKSDLSKSDAVEKLSTNLQGIELGMIVSNAGTGTPGLFGDCDLDLERALVQLNCVTSLELARMNLPEMQRRGRGAIILVASMMGFQGVPYMAHYSAMKGYLLNLGEGLYHEYKDGGIDVLALAPGATDTPGKNLHDIDYDKLPVKFLSPEFVVDKSLAALGKKPCVIPGLQNHFTACLSSGLWTRKFVQKLMHRFARIAIH